MDDAKDTPLPLDVLRAHIIPRLDGATLAATACATSQFKQMTSHDHLWERACISTWPSLADPRIRDAVSSFPCQFKSLYSDAQPLIHRSFADIPRKPHAFQSNKLVTALDVYYKQTHIFSKVAEITSSLNVELLDAKEFVRDDNPKDSWLRDVEENVTLSWIVIDPEIGRAVNLSSHRAVVSQRHWLTGNVQLRFAVVLESGQRWAEWGATVTFSGGADGEEVRVREAFVEMEGTGISGGDGLLMLRESMIEVRIRRRFEEDWKKVFEEFLEKKRLRKLWSRRKEKVKDTALIFLGLFMVFIFWLWLFCFL